MCAWDFHKIEPKTPTHFLLIKIKLIKMQFDKRLGALLPEDVVYEILTIGGHGNWRLGRGTGNGKFIWRIPADDPRFAMLDKMPKIESVKFYVDVSGNGFNAISYDYYVNLPIREANSYLQIFTAEFIGHNAEPIDMTRYMIKKIDNNNSSEHVVYYENIFYARV
jgi:hypothetical protein